MHYPIINCSSELKKSISGYSSDTSGSLNIERDMRGRKKSAPVNNMKVENNDNNYKEDVSTLQQPVRTSFLTFSEAQKAFVNGTDEVRHILLYECNIIFECNACRNMFRCLANFINHKKKFCLQSSSGNFNGVPTHQTSSYVISPTARDVVPLSRQRLNIASTGAALANVVDRLNRVQREQLADNGKIEHQEEDSVILELEPVPTTSHAVYQTMTFNDIARDTMKAEVDEVQELEKNRATVLGVDGKALSDCAEDTERKEDDVDQAQVQVIAAKHCCDICNAGFQTEKLLSLHTQKKHTDSTLVHPCPSCSKSFLHTGGLARHLTNEHKKSQRRIRLMRNAMVKRVTRIGDLPSTSNKGLSRELKRLETMREEARIEAFDNLENNLKSICKFCGKEFERRAALSTHINSCRAKLESDATTKKANNNCKRAKQQINVPATVTNSDLSDQSELQKELEKAFQDEVESTEIVVDAANILEIEEELHLEKEDELPEPEDIVSLFNANNDTEAYIELCEKYNSITSDHGLENVKLKSISLTDDDNNLAEKEKKKNNESSELNNLVPTDDEKKMQVKSKKSPQKTRMMSEKNRMTCRCKLCDKQFEALSNLRRHISMYHYRSERYGCTLCSYRAFRRYDIVNHVSFKHNTNCEREEISEKYVTMHDVAYSKEDVEGDIVIVKEVAASEIIDNEKSPKLKRKKLPSADMPDSDAIVVGDILENGNKFKKARRHTETKPSLNDKQSQERPIRNRLKVIKKDFVYDLSKLQTEHTQPIQQLIGPKRRYAGDFRINTPTPLFIDKPNYEALIKGSALRIATSQVSQGYASSATIPEFPTERPQIRPRLFSNYLRTETTGAPIIDGSELEAARMKSGLLEDTFLAKIAGSPNSSFRIKTCLATQPQNSKIDKLLEKVDLRNKGITETIENSMCSSHGKIVGKCEAVARNSVAALSFIAVDAMSASFSDAITVQTNTKYDANDNISGNIESNDILEDERSNSYNSYLLSSEDSSDTNDFTPSPPTAPPTPPPNISSSFEDMQSVHSLSTSTMIDFANSLLNEYPFASTTGDSIPMTPHSSSFLSEHSPLPFKALTTAAPTESELGSSCVNDFSTYALHNVYDGTPTNGNVPIIAEETTTRIPLIPATSKRLRTVSSFPEQQSKRRMSVLRAALEK